MISLFQETWNNHSKHIYQILCCSKSPNKGRHIIDDTLHCDPEVRKNRRHMRTWRIGIMRLSCFGWARCHQMRSERDLRGSRWSVRGSLGDGCLEKIKSTFSDASYIEKTTRRFLRCNSTTSCITVLCELLNFTKSPVDSGEKYPPELDSTTMGIIHCIISRTNIPGTPDRGRGNDCRIWIPSQWLLVC